MTHLTIYEDKRTLRRDRAAWQRAALGLLVLSVAVNGVLCGLYLRQERQTERWRQKCLEMEAARDAALYGEPVLPPDVVYFSQQGENDNVWDKIGGHVFCYQYDWEANT